jgi:hypothetical protein
MKHVLEIGCALVTGLAPASGFRLTQRMTITLFTMLMIPPLLMISPPLIAVCGALLALRLHWTKWLIHFGAIAGILVAPLLSVYIENTVDPTIVEYPGPGGPCLLTY